MNYFIYAAIFIALYFVVVLSIYVIRKHRGAENAPLQISAGHYVKCKQLIEILFQDVEPTRVSIQARKEFGLQDSAFVYGEIEFEFFANILAAVNPKPSDVFYDLGSGAGKAVFLAALLFNLKQVCGVELIPQLHALSQQQLTQLKTLCAEKDQWLNKIGRIEFIQSNMAEQDLSDADIVFINATCIDDTVWQKLLIKLQQLKAGSRIILTTKQLESEHFQALASHYALMSWGYNSVHIYQRTEALQLQSRVRSTNLTAA